VAGTSLQGVFCEYAAAIIYDVINFNLFVGVAVVLLLVHG
jgi:hypothetical protein